MRCTRKLEPYFEYLCIRGKIHVADVLIVFLRAPEHPSSRLALPSSVSSWSFNSVHVWSLNIITKCLCASMFHDTKGSGTQTLITVRSFFHTSWTFCNRNSVTTPFWHIIISFLAFLEFIYEDSRRGWRMMSYATDVDGNLEAFVSLHTTLTSCKHKNWTFSEYRYSPFGDDIKSSEPHKRRGHMYGYQNIPIVPIHCFELLP